MTIIMLLFAGSAYFINGIASLGRIDPKSSAPINLFVGVALSLVTVSLAIDLPASNEEGFSQAAIGMIGFPLFAFTFLYVGILNYTEHSSSALGWFCGWSVLVCLGLSWSHVSLFADVSSGLLWVVWAVVFASLFATMILGMERLTAVTGWFLVIAGFSTCVVPASMMLIGSWTQTPSLFVWVIEVGTIAFYLAGSLKALGSRNTVPG